MLTNREDTFWERHRRAPLYEKLLAYAKSHPHPFHVPGHKLGASFDREGKERFHSILSLDVTEISGMDDLHQPQGVIAEAQALAAEAFHADETRFLVGGSTAGNIALVMAVCKPGDTIIVQRNCHKSVYNGIILARAKPVFVVPAVDLQTGVAACVRREDVERALIAHPEAKAVFLTNPTYYGMGVDLQKMAATVHRFDVPLLVDEAHGSHYGFHPALPLSAMQCGADAAVQSTHKMTPAMTMSSMLHLKGSRIDRERLYRALAMIQSSSPSYPLMASLDLARRHMVLETRKELDRVLPLLERVREQIASLSWLAQPSAEEGKAYSTLDPLKLLLCLRTGSMTGYQLQSLLEAHGVFLELAEAGHVLLAASTGTSLRDVETLWQVLDGVTLSRDEGDDVFRPGVLASDFLREQVIPMHEALDAKRCSVPPEEAEGRVCAEMVIPYPPGIPLLAPGERIDGETVALLRQLQTDGVRFHGVKDASLATIQIVA